jgi:Amt family ammonium transporter
VVHINAAIAGLIGAYMVGKRVGYGKDSMAPHSLTMTMIGASLLWFGWFGFNAGSALEANGTAALAFVNTWLATAMAATVLDGDGVAGQGQALDAGRRFRRRRGSRGDHPGGRLRRRGRRHDHRPAAGVGLPVGREWPEEAARRRRLARRVRRAWRRRHPRRLLTGVFAAPSLGGSGIYDYVANKVADNYDIMGQVMIQATGVGVTLVWSGTVAFICYKIVDIVVGLRVPEDEEREGLDITSHGESAYHN